MLLVLEHRVHLCLGDFRTPLYYHLELERSTPVADNFTIILMSVLIQLRVLFQSEMFNHSMAILGQKRGWVAECTGLDTGKATGLILLLGADQLWGFHRGSHSKAGL